MADATTYIAKYLRAVADPLRAGAWDELMAEDCIFEGYGTNRADNVKRIQEDLGNGLVAHNPIATAAAGEFLVAVAELCWRDSRQVAAGIIRFNADGLAAEIVARVPVEGQAGSTDAATHVGRWMRVVEAFNRGDMATFGEAMAEDCTWEGVGGKIETLKALQQGRDDGWVSHNTIGTASAGEFLVATYENRFADGRSVIGAGIVRLNADGLFSEFVSREPGPAGTVIATG
jgi:hypothetical protein